MVYKKVEIKYTALHVMQSCTKKANIMYTGQGNKEQISQDLKDRFLIFLLILLIKDGFLTDLLINRLHMLILSFYLMYYDFLLYIFLYFCVVNTVIFFHFKFFIFQCSVRGQEKGRYMQRGGGGGGGSRTATSIEGSFSAWVGLGKLDRGLGRGVTFFPDSDSDRDETFQISRKHGLEHVEFICLLDSQLWLKHTIQQKYSTDVLTNSLTDRS